MSYINIYKDVLWHIQLNRPDKINALNLDMVNQITEAFSEAMVDDSCRGVIFTGSGTRGFCSGGDITANIESIKKKNYDIPMQFFRNEYAMDYMIHSSHKPVIAIADGITMGGGLGIAAGADFIIVTENSRLALPETGIGFFPDIGATRWLFSKCSNGYPEFLALSGYELKGGDSVRIGLASHYIPDLDKNSIIKNLHVLLQNKNNRENDLEDIKITLDESAVSLKSNEVFDDRVEDHFSGKSTIFEIFESLENVGTNNEKISLYIDEIKKKSPTAMVLTFNLLQYNQNKNLAMVFENELVAADFMIHHHDYLEGVSAKLIERDREPRWSPNSLEEVGTIPFDK